MRCSVDSKLMLTIETKEYKDYTAYKVQCHQCGRTKTEIIFKRRK